MIKKFENFNELDPYGEEDWNDNQLQPSRIDWDTEIELGDVLYFHYDRDGQPKYMGKIIDIIDTNLDYENGQKEYILDTNRVVWKSKLIGAGARIEKRKLNEGIHWWKDGKLGEEEPNEKPVYDDILPDNGFRQFLIDNNCYKEFLYFCETTGFRKKEDFYKHRRWRWLDVSFHWLKTGNGEFWAAMDNKWRKEINKYPPDMNEGLYWWKDGKLGPEEDIEDENEKDYDGEKIIRDRLKEIKDQKNKYISVGDYSNAAVLRDEERKLLKKLGEL